MQQTKNVRSEPIRGAGRPRIGFLRPAHIERAFMVLVYLALLALVLLSLVGTFYGQLALPAPIKTPWQIVLDIIAAPKAFGIAFATQGVLALAQYGAKQFSRHDRRWWFLYLAALGFSVYYNVQAYWSPLAALGLAWYVSGPIILAGDIVPEIAAVRHN